jgi:hypothetical protein
MPVPVYKFAILPKGSLPKTVGYELVLQKEINEIAAEGWEVVTMNRNGQFFTPMDVLFRKVDGA